MSSNAWTPNPRPYDEYLHPNNWTTETALETLTRRDPIRPFFLQVGYHRLHPPYDPPARFFEMYLSKNLAPVPVGDWADEYDVQILDVAAKNGRLSGERLDLTRKAYYAQITALDHQIGRLMHFLRQKGLYDDTLIIFASDHGEMLGDHHHFAKTVPFEGSSRIPFIVKLPAGGDFPVDRVAGSPVSLIDIMPIVLDVAGIKIPKKVEGKSLLPILREEVSPVREFVHGEHSPCWQFIIDDRYKYACCSDTGREYFFDLEADP